MQRLLFMLFTGLAMSATFAAQSAKDWPNVGNDPGGTKYSTLTQITPANVTNLVKAWTYDTGIPATGYPATPIVINDVMYVPMLTKIAALKADTGTELWKFDIKSLPDMGPNPSAGQRGVAYWPGTAQAAPRIVIVTTNGFLIQLDAKTGQLIPAPVGLVNLSTGVTEKFGGGYSTNTTPSIYKNLAIIAARTGEQGRYGLPGDPRAFNLITGEEA